MKWLLVGKPKQSVTKSSKTFMQASAKTFPLS